MLGVKGGVGATTLAVNLALALTAQARTVLADLEGGGTAAAHLGLGPSRGLNNLLTLDAEAIDRASVEAALTAHPSGLRLLTAAEGPVDATRIRATCSQLLSLCDVCVFDLGSRLGQANLAIAQRSRDVIVVLDSGRATLMQAQRTLKALNQSRLSKPATKIVCVNRLGLGTETIQAAIQAALGQNPTAIVGPAGEALYDAMEQGQPLAVQQPDHPFIVERHALAARLMSAA